MFILRIFLALVVLTTLAGNVRLLAHNDDALLAQLKTFVQKAALTGDAAELKTALERAREAAKQSARKAEALYYCGFAQYHLSMLPSEKDAKERHADEGIAALEEAVQLEPTFADAQALLGSLYGVKAGSGMFNGMKYGSKSTSTMEHALALAPNNPRAMILRGVSLYYTPPMWGGDKQKALALLQKACELAEQGACAAKTPTTPDWGHAEAFAWKGVMLAGADDPDHAQAAYERALNIAPDYAWVRVVLLPKLGAK
jgi:tetratricopeptide (TPR) repeat protein